MSILRDYLLLGRIHTASLTMGLVLIGYFLAGGEILSWGALGWIIFAVLYHYTGFLQNNLFDYKWDKEDPNKRSHPLASGRISIHRATWVYTYYTVLAVLYGLVLTNGNPVSVLSLLMIIAFGTIYNATSKRTFLAPFFLALLAPFIIMVSYFSVQDQGSPILALVVVYAFLQMLFQIAWEGNLKDFNVDQANALKEMGCELEKDDFRPSLYAYLLGSMIRVVLFIFVWPIMDSMPLWILPYIAFAFPAFLAGFFLASRHRWPHKGVVKMSALTEILTYFALLVALGPFIGMWAIIFLIVLPLMWFITFNRAMWGSWVTPKV